MREGESQKKPETEIKGFSVSKGIAHGEAFVLLHKELQTPVYEVRDADKPAEIKRFENAILKTRKDILDVKSELSEEIGSAEASIFDAHILVLEDVAVMQETLSMFKENNYNIEYCYSSVINKFIAAFERIDDPYIKERIADFKDVSRRVLGNMLGVQTSKIGALSDPLILVSSDFAPADFSLVDKDGNTVSLSDFAGRKAVVYFYPKDNTPGCTRQACAFAAAYGEFEKRGVVVIGISKDGVASHAKFAQKYGLPFILLSDPDLTAIKAYGVWQEKKMYGKTVMGVARTTFIVGEDGMIEAVMPKVNPDTNAGDVLALL